MRISEVKALTMKSVLKLSGDPKIIHFPNSVAGVEQEARRFYLANKREYRGSLSIKLTKRMKSLKSLKINMNWVTRNESAEMLMAF
jgi:hypothetical protein